MNSNKKSAIILADKEDTHAKVVKHEIELLGFSCAIIDVADFPAMIQFENQIGCENTSHLISLNSGEKIDFDCIAGIWRRRLHRHIVSNELDDNYKEISKHDSQFAREGFLLTFALNGGNVINNPIHEAPALNKSYQLNVAEKVGIAIPKTIITNNPQSVRTFYDVLNKQNKKVVYKVFRSPRTFVVPTSILSEEDFERLNDLSYAPVIFQEYCEGRNLRVTCVRQKIFAAEVLVRIPEAERDWRIEGYNQVIPFKLDELQEKKILKLMALLKLDYGAIDFKLKVNGEIVFLEVNPWGQYLFVEVQTGLPISRSIAEALCKI